MCDLRPPGKHGIGLLMGPPLTLEDVIEIGLTNNLELWIHENMQNRELLARKLRMLPGLNANVKNLYQNKLRKCDVYNWKLDMNQEGYTESQLKNSSEAVLSLTWNMLGAVIRQVHFGRYAMDEKNMNNYRVHHSQQLALDITEAYWQAAAVEDALDYIHVVEKRVKDIINRIAPLVSSGDLDKMDAEEADLRLRELEFTIRYLKSNLSRSRMGLSYLMGLNKNVQYILARPPVKPIVAALPFVKSVDIDRLEEYALSHRPDLPEGDISVLTQKQEAKIAFLTLFPGFNLFESEYSSTNRLLLFNKWNSIGAAISMDMLNIPSALVTLKKHENTSDITEARHLLMRMGVIAQVHIALLDYAIKLDRFRMLEQAYIMSADLLKMAREKNRTGHLPEPGLAQYLLEEMTAKFRRDEAVVDLLSAYKRLCVSIGVESLAVGDGQSLGDSVTTDDDSLTSYNDQGDCSVGWAVKRWKCLNCAYIHAGSSPPQKCPICGTSGAKFKEYHGSQFSHPDSIHPGADSRSSGVPSCAATLSDRFARDASEMFLWKLIAGFFSKSGKSARHLSQIKGLELRLSDSRDVDIEMVNLPRYGLVNRLYFKGLTHSEVKIMAAEMKRNSMEYWIIPPRSADWQSWEH
ncbi:MAG: TolC family protein [Desulfobacterales bacterium]|nr:TolC family protein [Desulfobacterales bacterium]